MSTTESMADYIIRTVLSEVPKFDDENLTWDHFYAHIDRRAAVLAELRRLNALDAKAKQAPS
eukprot:m.286679 g.286679  ORF g.286679 m.286679 type:complete len:62 (+) comp95653_c0_seq1:145-330(+)